MLNYRNTQCLYPRCENTRRTRGACHGHYQAMRAMVRAGSADEVDLVDRFLLLKKGHGNGGSPIRGSEIYTLGNIVRGRIDRG